MAYQVLARKYRPQLFEEIIGQAHVATTLTNALQHQKVAHAYLFSGPRGVGKTTTARILAKALNCAKGPTSTPCNACDSCQRIAQGQEMVDVLEIDAASNRGIEEIRELRDNVRYAPARSRYKVYIIDEAHQITHDAFNAFLKTLEEPPEHVVFVLATTEHQKIPATISSRCQLFRFKRVSAADLATQLEKILAQEKVSVERQAVERLARAAGGSVRDGLSLMDQALAYTTGTLTAKQVETLLGFLPEEFLVGFASALLERQPAGVLQWIKQLVEEGWELPQFVRDFREFLRLSLVEQLSGGASPAALKLSGRPVSLAEILQMIKVMGQCVDEMRWNDNPQLVLELYSLRLTQTFVDAGILLRRLEELEKNSGAGPAPVPLRPPVSSAPRPIEPRFTPPPVPLRTAPIAPKGDVAPALASDKAKAPAPSSAGNALWRQFQAELWKKPAVASQMERAFLKSATETEWVVAFADKFAMDFVQRSLSFVQETLASVAGHPVAIRFVQELRATREADPMTVPARTPAAQAGSELEDSAPSLAGQHELSPGPTDDESQDPHVQKVLQMFKGRVRPGASQS